MSLQTLNLLSTRLQQELLELRKIREETINDDNVARAEESKGELSNDVCHGQTDRRGRTETERKPGVEGNVGMATTIYPSTPPLVSLRAIQFTVYHYRVYTGNLTRTHAKNISGLFTR